MRSRGLFALLVALAVLAACLPAAGAAATGTCSAAPAAVATELELAQAIETVPCQGPSVSYDAFDVGGDALDVLDPIPDPAGGYLGVYQTPLGSGRSAQDFRVGLAYSHDLIHWMQVAVLYRSSASTPMLQSIPGTDGYLLAVEKYASRARDHIELRYFPSLARLVAARAAAQADPRRLGDTFNNGTPAIDRIVWHGTPSRSVIDIGFHYEVIERGGRPGADREATGVLTDFRRWTAAGDTAADRVLDRLGLRGNHGATRTFALGGHRWKIYEAQSRVGDFATWHLVLVNAASGAATPLTISSPFGSSQTSFGNPTVQVLPAPSGGGDVLTMTMFAFGAGTKFPQGELVYYKPLE